MPSVSPTGPMIQEGSPPPPVSPAGSMELEGLGGSMGMGLSTQCSVESLGSLDSGHSSSQGVSQVGSQAASPEPASPTPTNSTQGTPQSSTTPNSLTPSSSPASSRPSSGQFSPRISLVSMGEATGVPQYRITPPPVDRSLSTSSMVSNTSMASNTSRKSSASSTSTVTPIKSKEELEAYNDKLDSLWDQEDDWIMIFDNLIKNTESKQRTRRHTTTHNSKHHNYMYSHLHSNGTSSNHNSPYQSPHKKGKVEDETDRASVKSGGSKSRASSAPPVRRSVLGAALPPKSAGSRLLR